MTFVCEGMNELSASARDFCSFVLKMKALANHSEKFIDISPTSVECRTTNRRLIIHFGNVCVFIFYTTYLSGFNLQPVDLLSSVDLSAYLCDDEIETLFHMDSDSWETDDDEDYY